MAGGYGVLPRVVPRGWGTPRIQGDYRLHSVIVASLLTSTELDKLTEGVLAKLRPLPLVQREIVIRRLVEYDERARQRSPRFSPASRLALAVRRDGVM